ncbi:MAG: ABC transporter substrate-binding protein [Caldilineaceae bacterium]
MMYKTRLGALALIVALLLTACQPIPAEVAEQGAQIYVLGVAQPFTGPLGSFGTDFGKAIDLAVEQMNAQLAAAGSNIQFEVASADTEGTPDGAAKAVQTVVQSSGAQVVVGPLTTGEVLGAKQYADENDIVIVAPASSGVAGAIAGDNIFRLMNPPDTFGGAAFLKIAAARGYENIAILQVDDVFGNGLAELFDAGFKANGGKETAIVKYVADAPDLSGEVSSISAEVARLSTAGSTAFFCICFLGDAQRCCNWPSPTPIWAAWIGWAWKICAMKSCWPTPLTLNFWPRCTSSPSPAPTVRRPIRSPLSMPLWPNTAASPAPLPTTRTIPPMWPCCP